jgi:hypothetical protein
MNEREWYHLSHEQDKQMISRTNKYDSLTENEKAIARQKLVSTQDTCSGLVRLHNHRLWIELVVQDYLSNDPCYEINDYSPKEIENICLVWFFENWMTSDDYKLGL